MTGYKECDKNVQGVHRSLTNRVLSPSNRGLNLCRENSSKLGALIWHIKYHQKVWGNVCWKQNRDVLMKCWWCLAVDRYQNIDPDLTCYHRCGSSGETITKDNRLLTGEIEFQLVSNITRITFKSTPAIVVKQGKWNQTTWYTLNFSLWTRGLRYMSAGTGGSLNTVR